MALNSYKASIYNFIFNSINAIVVIANGIIMVPIYFHYMSVSTYGAWLASGNVVALLGLLESGLSFVITQKLAASLSSEDETGFRTLAGSNILSSVFITLLILIFGLILAPFITGWINVEPAVQKEITIAFIISVIASCLSITVSLLGAFPQVWQETKQVGVYNTISSLIAIGSIVLFLWCGFGVISIALSYLIRSLLNLILYSSWIWRKWKEKEYGRVLFSLNDTFLLTKACFYPFLSKVSSTLVLNSQGLLIAHFITPAATAVFDITSKVCSVACGFAANTNGSFFALLSLSFTDGDKNRSNNIIQNTSLFFFTLLFGIALYSLCFSEAIVNYWVGIDKFGGKALLATIVISNVLYQIRAYLNNILYAGGFITLSAKRDILWMLCYIIFLCFTINNLKIYAIPISTTISCIVFIVVYSYMISKHLGIEMRPLCSVLLKSLFLICPLVLVHFYININYQCLRIYIYYFCIFTIIYLALLFAVNIKFLKQIKTRFINEKS